MNKISNGKQGVVGWLGVLWWGKRVFEVKLQQVQMIVACFRSIMLWVFVVNCSGVVYGADNKLGIWSSLTEAHMVAGQVDRKVD